MLITCLAILAVDFRIFPRRFAKTETFGISLMDIGVGTFIVSSAVTSRYARGQYPPRLTKSSYDVENNRCYNNNNNNNNNNGNSNEKNKNKNENENENENDINNNESNKKMKSNCSFSEIYRIIQLFFYLQTQNWKHYLVLILGLGRMVALKVFNYHENVSEYGVHWNFFVTLFSIWQISDFLHRFLSRKYLHWFAITVLLLYQFTLSKTTMTDFIFAASRKNFFYANREGFLSLFGYVPMYLLVEMLAYHFFYRCEHGDEDENENEEINDENYDNDDEDENENNTNTDYPNINTNNNCKSNCRSKLNDSNNYNYINSSSSNDSYNKNNNSNNNNNNNSNNNIDDNDNNNNDNDDDNNNEETCNNNNNNSINYGNNLRNSPLNGENRAGLNSGENNSGKFRKTNFEIGKSKNNYFFSFRSDQTADSTHSDKETSSTLFLPSPATHHTNKRSIQNCTKNVLNYPYFKDKIGNKSQRHFYRQLTVISSVLWVAWLASSSVQQTSRRLANLAYVSLVLALSFTLILLIAVADSMGDLVLSYKGSLINNNSKSNNDKNRRKENNDISSNNNNSNADKDICKNENINVNIDTNIDEMNTKSSKLDQAILPQCPVVPLTIKTLECLNEHQLPVFLVSNVITGIINMTIKTIYSSHVFAFFIISLYAMAFIGFAWIISDKLKKK